MSFLLSFRQSVWYLFISVTNIAVICDYWNYLKQNVKNIYMVYLVFVVSIGILTFIITKWGYFPVSTTLKSLI